MKKQKKIIKSGRKIMEKLNKSEPVTKWKKVMWKPKKNHEKMKKIVKTKRKLWKTKRNCEKMEKNCKNPIWEISFRQSVFRKCLLGFVCFCRKYEGRFKSKVTLASQQLLLDSSRHLLLFFIITMLVAALFVTWN